MVIGLLAITAIPTVIGVSQAVSTQKNQNALSKEKEKFYLTATLEFEGELYETNPCVLENGRLVINLPGDTPVQGHTFCGFYFTYPSEEQHLGLVSTISDDLPMLNWIFINKDTHAVKCGGRKETIGHIIGPWGWNDNECFLTLRGDHEAFIAKREDNDNGEGRWVVYWDPGHEILATAGPQKCKALGLRRRLVLGVESHYVRDKASSAQG